MMRSAASMIRSLVSGSRADPCMASLYPIADRSRGRLVEPPSMFSSYQRHCGADG
jgi:hypothetical protein